MITGAQIRMARGFLKWSVKDLKQAAAVSEMTIKRMEAQDDIPNALGPNIQAVKQALDLALKKAGAELVSENKNGGAGIRLLKKQTL